MSLYELYLKELTQTCESCPSQWEGKSTDDRPVYIRYRYGYLSVRAGPPGGDIDSAVIGKEVLGMRVGSGLDGMLSESEMISIANITVKKE